MKRVLNNLAICAIAFCGLVAHASEKSYLYVFDYVTPMKTQKNAISINLSPIGGNCVFSFGAYGGDNFLVLEVNRSADYIKAKSGIWVLSLPIKQPWPPRWEEDGYEYRYVGQEWVVIGHKKMLAHKIISLGSGGLLSDSTELWLDDKHGILAYRPMTNPGRFILNSIPRESLLDCR